MRELGKKCRCLILCGDRSTTVSTHLSPDISSSHPTRHTCRMRELGAICHISILRRVLYTFLVECRSVYIFLTWCRNAYLEVFAIGKRAYPQPAILEAHHFWYSFRCCRKTQVSERVHSICDRECLLQGPDTSELPKVVTGWEGAKGALAYVNEKPVALVQKMVALVQRRVKMVQETFGRPFLQLIKTPFAPSPNHLGQF